MRKLFLLSFFTFALGAFAQIQAQVKTIKGKVSDESGNPLPFASVSLTESGTGVKSDSLGNYTIKVPDDGKKHLIQFGFVGYENTSLLANGNTINIKLKKSTQGEKAGDEVVVIGYQQIKRKDIIGAVSSIGAKDLKDIPVSSAAEALSGKLAGVQVVTSEGTPGASSDIKVRGTGSITQSNSPLYIVDGIEIENALDNISPQDIQSIDVLKDASATAIYGARGSNGVIVITTKGGKNSGGKTAISYNGLAGYREITKELDVLSPYDFLVFQYEKAYPSTSTSVNPLGINIGYAGSKDSADLKSFFSNRKGEITNPVNTFADLANYKKIPTNNWQDIVFGRHPSVQTHNVSITSGNKTTNFNLSFTNNDEGGIMLNSGFNRKIVNFKLEHQATEKIKLGFNVRYNNQTIDGAGTSNDGSASFNRLRNSIRYKPYGPVSQFDPNYYATTAANGLGLINPVLLAYGSYKKNTTDNINVNGSLSYALNPLFTFKTTFGVDKSSNLQKIFNDTVTSESRIYGSGLPTASIITTERVQLTWTNVLSFSSNTLKGRFFEKNSIDGLIGNEIYTDKKTMTGTEADLLPNGTTADKAFSNMDEAGLVKSLNPLYSPETRLVSFFTKLNYGFDNKKYVASFTFRADGSSKFASGNQWGYFPSMSLVWKASQEQFLEKLLPKFYISDLKVRGTLGTSGNNRIDDYLFQTTYVSGAIYGLNGVQGRGYVPTANANKNIKWETSISRNLGFDLGLFKNKVQVVVDVYKNTTNDLLVFVPQPSNGYPGSNGTTGVGNGFSQQIQNVGTIENRGVEFQISAPIMQKKNFRWSENFNISYNVNEIKSLGSGQNSFQVNSGWGSQGNDYIVQVGKALGAIYGFQTSGDGIYHVSDYTDATFNKLKAGVPNDAGILGLKSVPQPGMLKLQKRSSKNGDSLTTDDQTILGNATPKFTGGLNQQFTYKNFDFSVFMNFIIGNKILNANSVEFTNGYYTNANMLASTKKRYSTIDDNGNLITNAAALESYNKNRTMWRPITNANFFIHSKNVEDGSFLKVSNVTIGYSLKDKLIKRMHLSRCRVYSTVNNLLVITKYTGYDPEVNTRRTTPMTPGVDYSAYPRNRMYVFGLNVTF